MKKIKDVQEALMIAITNFVIAVKAGNTAESDYQMGLVHAYMYVLGEFARLGSPWVRFWCEGFTSAYC